MEKEKYSWQPAESEDTFDEPDDYSGAGINAPKHSPMRRKEKFREKEFRAEKKHKDRKRQLRNKNKYDFEL